MKNDENIFIEKIVIYTELNLLLSFSFSKIKFLRIDGEFNVESFSLLNENCKDIFYSLKFLGLCYLKNKSLFNNLAKNIKNCKNLECLMVPMPKELLKEYNNNSISELTNKFLPLKMPQLILSTYKQHEFFYTFEELQELFPNKLPSNYERYLIPKIK